MLQLAFKGPAFWPEFRVEPWTTGRNPLLVVCLVVVGPIFTAAAFAYVVTPAKLLCRFVGL